MSPDKVTRIEIIDETGRAYVRWNTKIELSYQDDGKTLKIFVEPQSETDDNLTWTETWVKSD